MYFRQNGNVTETFGFSSGEMKTEDHTESSKKCGVPMWLVILLVLTAVAGGWWLWNQKTKTTEGFKKPEEFGFRFY